MFQEIEKRILSARNLYEEANGIKTLKVECIFKKDSIAFFLGEKSDGRKTLFIALKFQPRTNNDSWGWFCPDEEQAEVLGRDFYNFYDRINKENG